jgi:hypothetical protein
MKASDVMSRTVTCIDEQASIARALQLMLGICYSGRGFRPRNMCALTLDRWVPSWIKAR